MDLIVQIESKSYRISYKPPSDSMSLIFYKTSNAYISGPIDRTIEKGEKAKILKN